MTKPPFPTTQGQRWLFTIGCSFFFTLFFSIFLGSTTTHILEKDNKVNHQIVTNLSASQPLNPTESAHLEGASTAYLDVVEYLTKCQQVTMVFLILVTLAYGILLLKLHREKQRALNL